MLKLTNEQIKLIKQKIFLKDGSFVVRLNVSGNKEINDYDCNNNVYCINDNYEILWRINPETTKFKRDSFVNINFVNNILTARKFFGFEYKVDIETGKARIIGWDK